jgi:hypothetical protein
MLQASESGCRGSCLAIGGALTIWLVWHAHTTELTAAGVWEEGWNLRVLCGDWVGRSTAGGG